MITVSVRSPIRGVRGAPGLQSQTMTNEKVTGPASYFPSIEKKYGKPIAEWKALIRSKQGLKHMELVNWLKAEYGLGHGHANALLAHTLAEDLPRG